MGLGSIGKLFVEIGADISGLNKGLSGAQNKVNAFGDGVKKTGAKIGSGMSSAGRGMTMGVTAPIVAMGAGFMGLSGKAANFENQMNRVYTLLPGISEKAMGQMEKDILAVSREMGILPEDAVPALYQALSAGVPPDNVFEFMRTAAKASIGGVTDIETAVDGLTSVVNAYGAEVLSASEASDIMAMAATKGKTDMEPMSKALYNVIPTAASLGVGFGDVAASLATLTASGRPTAVATTQLRQLFVELSKDTSKTSKAFKEVAGVGFQEFISQGGNVQDALGIMETAAANNGVALQDMFGSVEAGNAALGLTGEGAKSLSDNIDAMDSSAGAADDKFDTMSKGATHSMDLLKAEFSAAAIELGNEFLPILKDDIIPVFRDDVVPLLTDVVVPAIKVLAGAFSKMSPGMRKVALIVGGLAAAFGPVLMILGPIISGVSALAPVITAIGGIIGGVALGPIALIVGAIAVIIGIVALVRKAWSENWGGIQEKTAAVWEWLKGFFSGLVDGAKTAISGFVSGITSGMERFVTVVRAKIADVVARIHGFVGRFRNAGRGLMDAFVGGVQSKIDSVVATVRTALAKVEDLLPFSDAKEGPLSHITASGAALMTTFEKGINSSSARPAEAFAARAPDVGAVGGAGAGAGTTSNSSSISIGEVHLSKDYDFEALMKDIDRHQQSRRMQRGIGTI